jgi:sec-independent protein translocase protein TatC
MYLSAAQLILKEAKIRIWWIFCCFIITCGTCYWFSEDLLFLLVAPYLKISKTSFFICTQITESLNTYIAISVIVGIFFCIPYIVYQFWSFFIPSYTITQRYTCRNIIFLSGITFFFVLIITFIWIMPNIWLFLYKLSNTESEAQLFIIKLQPKIYDFSMLTLQVLFITIICSQIPVILICSIQYKLISINVILKSRKSFLLISLLFAALITPPDIWYQLVTWFYISILIELAIFTAIIQLQYTQRGSTTFQT